MGWGKIDDGFDEHPKVLALLDDEDQTDACTAITLWTLCFTWAHRNTRRRGKTPGLLPAGLPRRFLGPAGRDAASLLVKHQLWDEQAEGGWMIHDFGDYLPTEETRAARAEAGRRGAAKRWADKHAAESSDPTDSQPDGTLLSGNGKVPPSSQASDGNGVASDGSRGRARRGTTSSSSGGLPEPTPEPVPPSAGAASPTPASELTITQRSKRITDAYAKAEPMCKWPAVNGIVQLAIKSGKFTDDEIEAAVLRMAADNRSVTVDALRTELKGFPPQASSQQAAGRKVSSRDGLSKWKAKS